MESFFADLTKKEWYFQGFNAVPALLYGPAFSMVRDMPAFLGYGYTASVIFFEQEKAYYLYAWDDLERIFRELWERYTKDAGYLTYIERENERICTEVLAAYQKIGSENWAVLSPDIVYSLWREVNRLCGRLLSVSHCIEGFTLVTEGRIRNLVAQEYGDDTDTMMLLTMPSRHSFITTERYDLCCILRLATQKEISAITAGSLLLDSVIQEKIRRHQQKYFWKLNSYTSAKYVTTEDFTKELEGYSTHPEDIGKTIQEYERLPEHLEKKRALLQKISNVELIDLLRMQDTIFQIHDRRKECLTISVHYLDFLLAEIAKRAGVPIEDARYTRISELEDLSTMKDELAKRRTGSLYVLLQNASEYLFAGEEAKQLFHLFQRKNIQDSFVSSAVSNSKQLKGNCASLGKACGRVKVCRGEKEIANVEVGDILVACMTQPEYVPAMKKAAAVITDEGGLNCHAAIICRELGIPCLVGTATATHVLKDGMRVEVDATRGIVTIL